MNPYNDTKETRLQKILMKILDNFAKDKPPKQIFVICEEKGDLLTKENTVSKFLKVVY